MIKNNEILKLADFGLARAFGIPVKNFTHEVVTLWYRAPDILLGSKNYSTSVDMWSVGCIFAEIVTRMPLFMGKAEPEQLQKIFICRGTPTEEEWPGFKDLPLYPNQLEAYPDTEKYQPQPLSHFVPGLDAEGLDLLEMMLKCNPAERITAKDAMKHPYLRDVPDEIKNMK